MDLQRHKVPVKDIILVAQGKMTLVAAIKLYPYKVKI